MVNSDEESTQVASESNIDQSVQSTTSAFGSIELVEEEDWNAGTNGVLEELAASSAFSGWTAGPRVEEECAEANMLNDDDEGNFENECEGRSAFQPPGDAPFSLSTIGEDAVLNDDTVTHTPPTSPSYTRDFTRTFSSVHYGMPDASMDLGSMPVYLDNKPPGSDLMSEHMAKLVAYTPKMDMLRLSNSDAVHDQVLKVLQPLTCLTFLDLSRCNFVTDSGMHSLASFSSLKHLDLNRTLRIGDESLAHVRGLTELTYLDIGKRQAQGMFAELQPHGSLKRKIISDSGLGLLTTLQKLQWLGLGHTHVTNSGLNHLKKFPVLENVDLGGCAITDEGLEALKGIQNLKFLTLRRCEGIRDDGLFTLGEMTNLVGLDLGGCSLITEEGLEYLRLLQDLRTLDLASCRKIASTGLQQVGYLYALQHLDLSGMSELFGYKIDSLSTLTLLWWLNLSGNKELTDDGAKKLKELTQLKVLGLAGCVKLTYDGLMSFLPDLKKLKIVDLTKLPRISRSKLLPLHKKYTFVKLQQI